MKMKKTGLIALVVVMLTAMAPTLTTAASTKLRVEVNGERVWFPDAEPFMDKNQRVQVPIRFLSEVLGAKVEWNAKEKKITISQASKVVTLTIGNQVFYINGTSAKMDTVAMTKGSRTFVPLRLVSQALDTQMNWDKKTNTVEITTPYAVPKPKTEEPTSDGTKPVVQEMYGFKVTQFSDSKLLIRRGIYEEDHDKAAYLLSIIVTFGTIGENHAKQLEELEDILSQKIKANTVDSVMKYVESKTKREDILPIKYFKDSKYNVFVGSPENGDVNIKVYYK